MGSQGPNDDVSEPAVEVNVCAPSASVEASGEYFAQTASMVLGFFSSRTGRSPLSLTLFVCILLLNRMDVRLLLSLDYNVTAGVSTEVGGGEVDVKGSEVPSVDVKPKKRLFSRLTLFDKGNVEVSPSRSCQPPRYSRNAYSRNCRPETQLLGGLTAHGT